ncbi:glycosyltransferase [Methylocystis heyeri]|uniref:Glycosyltransferase n=1 Tax=Methylocystis heyeri TaxID=391905 RepID=A0A6B8KAX8_9HYPH|nr:glycosyltransferase [Methylocystis heyeri]QGM45266.1 glycosyltransferase [Methylocystis heyeri]
MCAALPKILIVTFGSLGDLHPFIALGQALQREGFSVVVASSSDHRERVEAHGLGFTPISPSLADIRARLGLDMGGLARRMSEDDGFLFRDLIFPHLHQSYEQLLAISAGAATVVAHSIAFSAHAAAEKLGIPLALVTLSPMLLYSAYDPPLGSRAPFIPEPRARLSLAYNRAMLGLFAELADRWAAPLRRFRRDLGLPNPGPFALFRGVARDIPTIGLHSALLAPPRPDHSPNLLVAGHSFHDAATSMSEEEAALLEEFLEAGEAPVVFTLGSFVSHGLHAHYRACVEAAQSLGKRAILLADKEDVEELRAGAPASVHVAGYVPHSQLFPRALAVAHHGGIGTSGQALRAGKPQLVTPFLGDQQDNSARLARLGVARALPGRKVSGTRLAVELAALLEKPDYARCAGELAPRIAAEDGPAAAAQRIAQLARRRK